LLEVDGGSENTAETYVLSEETRVIVCRESHPKTIINSVHLWRSDIRVDMALLQRNRGSLC